MAEAGIRFVKTRHHMRDVDVIEVWYRDKFIASIVPPPDQMADTAAITIISKYLDIPGSVIEASRMPPALMIAFDVKDN